MAKNFQPAKKPVKIFKRHFSDFKTHQIIFEYHEEDFKVVEKFKNLLDSKRDGQVDFKEAILALASLFVSKKD